MIHSHVRNRLYLVSSLCLCASFFLTGCGPASSSSGKSPESAAATQQAETVSQVTGPVPETLWDKRAEYEKEGQVVLFTDCGLYKGDTDELTGAKCEFRQGRWILLEPKLEPGDNLIKNGDFSAWDDARNMPVGFWYAGVDAQFIKIKKSDDFTSQPFSLFCSIMRTGAKPPQFLSLNNELNKSFLTSMANKYITFRGDFKTYNNSHTYAQIVSFDGESWQYHLPKLLISGNNLKWISYNFTTQITGKLKRLLLRISVPENREISIDDLIVVLGNLPMI